MLSASAWATTPYDPDASGLSPTPSTDLSVGSGVCTFDTNTGAISGTGCPSGRAAGSIGMVVNGIGAFFIPSSTFEQAGTMEFVMNSLNTASGALIESSGGANLVIATLHDLNVGSGASVNVDGQGQQGGSPGTAGLGPGAGDHSLSSSCPDAGGGGSFGGFGGDGGNGVPSGGMYGSTDQSPFLNQGSGGGGAGTGSGCGTIGGGNGGGGVGLVAMGTLTVNQVSANGTPEAATSNLPDQGGPGGGSGGAILLMSPHLVLAGQSSAQVKGGFGYSTSDANGSGGGGGGGGRITTVSDVASNPFSPLVVGGGLGGLTTNGGGIGLNGGEGNGGSFGIRPFVIATGPSSKQVGQVAAFSGSTALGNATFAWDFGDGTTDTGANPSHSYTAPGHYTVTLTATMDDSGQTATAQRSINVTPGPAGPGSGGGGSTPPPTGGGSTTPPPPAPKPQCVVPKLKGLSLASAKAKLRRAHCRLGKVRKPRLRGAQKHKPLVVSRTSPAAGKRRPNGSAVNLTLAPKKPKRRHHH
jgi:hypothetical protein